MLYTRVHQRVGADLCCTGTTRARATGLGRGTTGGRAEEGGLVRDELAQELTALGAHGLREGIRS